MKALTNSEQIPISLTHSVRTAIALELAIRPSKAQNAFLVTDWNVEKKLKKWRAGAKENIKMS